MPARGQLGRERVCAATEREDIDLEDVAVVIDAADDPDGRIVANSIGKNGRPVVATAVMREVRTFGVPAITAFDDRDELTLRATRRSMAAVETELPHVNRIHTSISPRHVGVLAGKGGCVVDVDFLRSGVGDTRRLTEGHSSD